MAIGRILTPTPTDRRAWRGPTRRSPAIRIVRAIERLLFVLGFLFLGYYSYVAVETRLYQNIENRELDLILASAPATLPLPEAAPAPPAPGSVLGRIEIPRLGVSTVIRAGSDARTLRLAVGHIPGTALPGQTGNIGLAGHRDTFFRRLRHVRADDDIRLVTTSGTFTFKVDATTIVLPKDTWVLDPTPVSTLTLVTCYPFTYVGSAPKRFIVHAVATS